MSIDRLFGNLGLGEGGTASDTQINDFDRIQNKGALFDFVKYKLDLLDKKGRFSLIDPEHYVTTDIEFNEKVSPTNFETWPTKIIRKVANNVLFSNEIDGMFVKPNLNLSTPYKRLKMGIDNLIIEVMGFRLKVDPKMDAFRFRTITQLMVLDQLAEQYVIKTDGKFIAMRKFDMIKRLFVNDELLKIKYITRFSDDYIKPKLKDVEILYNAIFSLYEHFYFMTLTIQPRNLTIGVSYKEIDQFYNKVITRIKNEVKKYQNLVEKKRKELPKKEFQRWFVSEFFDSNKPKPVGVDANVLKGNVDRLFIYHTVEFQKNGYPHLHILIAGVRWIDMNWLRRSIEFQERMINVNASYSKNYEKATQYMVKYMTKTIGDVVNLYEKDWNYITRVLSWALNARVRNTSTISLVMIDRLFYKFYMATNSKYKRLLYYALLKITNRIRHKLREFEMEIIKMRYWPYDKLEPIELKFVINAPKFEQKLIEIENKIKEYKEMNEKIITTIKSDWDVINNKLDLNKEGNNSNGVVSYVIWQKIGIYEIDELYDEIRTLNDLYEHYYKEWDGGFG